MASSSGVPMRVVVGNGLNDYIFWYSGRLELCDMKAAISRVLLVRPCDVLLYHEGVPLTNGAMDLRLLHVPPADLRLRMEVTIFIPQ